MDAFHAVEEQLQIELTEEAKLSSTRDVLRHCRECKCSLSPREEALTLQSGRLRCRGV